MEKLVPRPLARKALERGECVWELHILTGMGLYITSGRAGITLAAHARRGIKMCGNEAELGLC